MSDRRCVYCGAPLHPGGWPRITCPSHRDLPALDRDLIGRGYNPVAGSALLYARRNGRRV